MSLSMTDLKTLLNRLGNGGPAEPHEIRALLELSSPDQILELFETARYVRTRYFGFNVFLYGFIYFSTFCRNNCTFCRYRRDNLSLVRYRKSMDEILSTAKALAADGVHLIDLTMGEDPELLKAGQADHPPLPDLAENLTAETGLPVMLSPGRVPDDILTEFAERGISWYACYQETHTRELFNRLRPGQDFNARLHAKHTARDLGMLIEDGILTGAGETRDDLLDSILWMKKLAVDQARVMTLIPQPETPLANQQSQDDLTELKLIAILRLVLQDILIPASLDVQGLGGLRARLDAGANVVTSIVLPQKGLAGVANHDLDIDASRRTVPRILPILEQCGLTAADQTEYREWIQLRLRRTHRLNRLRKKTAC